MVKVFCVVDEEIDHQQHEGDHEEQQERDDQFYHDGKPYGLMIKCRLQKEDQNGCDQKTNDPKSKCKLINRNMNAQIITLPDKIEKEDNAEQHPDE